MADPGDAVLTVVSPADFLYCETRPPHALAGLPTPGLLQIVDGSLPQLRGPV